MFLSIIWFGSTLLLPVFFQLDKFLHLPFGSITVLSWLGSGFADRYLDKIQKDRRQTGQKEFEIPVYQEALLTVISTALLILAISAIKYLFTEGT